MRSDEIDRLVKDVLGMGVLRLKEWSTPATSYTEKREGNYRIRRTHYTRGTYDMNGIDDCYLFRVVKPIPITNLQEFRGKIWRNWMVDDPPHWRAMEIYAEHSKGRVLTTGLGLGLYLQAMKNNHNIESVTIVERSEEVIRLVKPYLPVLPNMNIIVGDFYEFIEKDNTLWDTIMVDLWVSRDREEKLRLYHHEVIPTAVDLRMKYPKASITFHGFYSVSDIKFATKEMVDLIVRFKEHDVDSKGS